MENLITPQNEFEKQQLEKYLKRAGKKDWFFRMSKKWWLNDLENLGPTERCVMITLKIHDNKILGCFPATRTLARELHVSQPTILKAIRGLEEKKLIETTKKAGRFNSYIFLSKAS